MQITKSGKTLSEILIQESFHIKWKDMKYSFDDWSFNIFTVTPSVLNHLVVGFISS